MATTRSVRLVTGMGMLVGATLLVAGAPPATMTYSKDVAPILFRHCVNCHRPGTTAPMSLLTYKDARPWAASMREKVITRVMPPWNADPRYGKFKNDPHLTDPEIATIVKWAENGAAFIGHQGNIHTKALHANQPGSRKYAATT